MKARMLLLTLALTVTGCATSMPRKPRWEIVISANVEYQPDHFTKTKAGVEFKRPLTFAKADTKETSK